MKKVSDEYKKQIGRNINEKIYFWKNFLKTNKKPILILEIGSGGGETLKSIKDLCKHNENLFAVDIKEEFVNLSKNIIGEKAILANVCKLPFENNFFDAINASSLFHEVNSYGFANKKNYVIGLKALNLALSEIKRVLKKDGLLYYRDVLAPKDRVFKYIKYSSVSTKFFIDLFLSKFVNQELSLYKGKYKLEVKGDDYLIYAENFLHREIQKHYLLCLENLSNYLFVKEKINVNILKGQNNLFIAEKLFSKLVLLNNLELRKQVLKWLHREGVEKYLYLTCDELIEFCFKDRKGYVLVPVSSNTKHRFIRNEQNLFIKKLINNAEEEGKQEIIFKKIKI